MMARRQFIAQLSAGAIAICHPASLLAAGHCRRRVRRPRTSCGSKKSAAKRVKSGDDFIQPDYEMWQQLKVGMSQAEVVALLGKPLHRQDTERGFHEIVEGWSDRDLATFSYMWMYGWLRFGSSSVPHLYSFDVSFNYKTRAVNRIHDPFDGRFSVDGRPTIPELVVPSDRTVFDHFPRFLDLRWHPSSGKYPIKYRVEIGNGQYTNEKYHYITVLDEVTHYPHLSMSYVGKGHGRWRVMATNEVGASTWCDYRYFQFTV